MTTKQKWDKWEIIAIKYLQDKSYTILATNYKFWRFWEVDIIAKKWIITYFLEVKYRENFKYWTPEESITKWKLRKLEKSIYSYCFKNKIDYENIQFDAIIIEKWSKSYKLKHYKNLEI